MKTQNKTLDQIYDVFALRVKVDTVRDCYAALGIIHEKYKPIPGRFKDYIAMPKANMYQSLHTTLIGHEGKPFEIQIRTYEMHRIAEYGIAAHWKYKESGSKNVTSEEEKLNWLREILEWQNDTTDNKEFMNAVKTDLDLFTDQVYVFTPSSVQIRPAGSVPSSQLCPVAGNISSLVSQQTVQVYVFKPSSVQVGSVIISPSSQL